MAWCHTCCPVYSGWSSILWEPQNKGVVKASWQFNSWVATIAVTCNYSMIWKSSVETARLLKRISWWVHFDFALLFTWHSVSCIIVTGHPFSWKITCRGRATHLVLLVVWHILALDKFFYIILLWFYVFVRLDPFQDTWNERIAGHLEES